MVNEYLEHLRQPGDGENTDFILEKWPSGDFKSPAWKYGHKVYIGSFLHTIGAIFKT
jgi:hypothetical protein